MKFKKIFNEAIVFHRGQFDGDKFINANGDEEEGIIPTEAPDFFDDDTDINDISSPYDIPSTSWKRFSNTGTGQGHDNDTQKNNEPEKEGPEKEGPEKEGPEKEGPEGEGPEGEGGKKSSTQSQSSKNGSSQAGSGKSGLSSPPIIIDGYIYIDKNNHKEYRLTDQGELIPYEG